MEICKITPKGIGQYLSHQDKVTCSRGSKRSLEEAVTKAGDNHVAFSSRFPAGGVMGHGHVGSETTECLTTITCWLRFHSHESLFRSWTFDSIRLATTCSLVSYTSYCEKTSWRSSFPRVYFSQELSAPKNDQLWKVKCEEIPCVLRCWLGPGPAESTGEPTLKSTWVSPRPSQVTPFLSKYL